MIEKIVVGHDEIRHLVDIMHYDDHPARVETPEFHHNKEELHAKIKSGEIEACLINNGYCEGQTEIHHFHVEYSENSAVDWILVQKDVKISNPDAMENLFPACHKHHMGTGTGIHMMSYPAYKVQRYLNAKNIALFEAAVAHIKAEMHPNHDDKTHHDHFTVNRKAEAILKKLAHNQANPDAVYAQK